MANPLVQILSSLTPPAPIVSDQYDGLEYRWKSLVFRPAQFKIEGVFIVGVLLYAVFHFIGKSSNAKRAQNWFEAHLPLLEGQFSKPTNAGLTSDGDSDFFNFSTGRRNVASLYTVFTFRPRHDPAQYIFQTLWSLVDLKYTPKDEVLLDFELTTTAGPDFVWAVVAKDELQTIRQARWDLTFTRTTEHPSLPSTTTVMSEFADITDNVLKPQGNFSLTKALNDPAILPYFRSLSITDQEPIRPASAPLPRSRRVLLSLTCPSSPSEMAATVPLITAVFKLVDSLDKISSGLRPETRTKLRKAREEVAKELKVEAERERKEEAAEDKKAAKKKVEEEKIAKLSAAEQKKFLERERKRNLRKAQGKVVRK